MTLTVTSPTDHVPSTSSTASAEPEHRDLLMIPLEILVLLGMNFQMSTQGKGSELGASGWRRGPRLK